VGQRKNNEDAFLADAKLGLFVVADGMGGYEGGEVASRLTVEAIRRFVSWGLRDDGGAADAGSTRGEGAKSYEEDLLNAAVVAAHEAIVAQRKGPIIEMGSTVVAALLTGRHLVVAHVGDSRLYRLRDGALANLTRDHSVWEALKSSGVPGHVRLPARNQLIRALGVEGSHLADVARHDVCLGDTYLLCSDGVYDPLDEGDIKSALHLGPGEGCAHLISQALRNGGADNLTGVMVRAIKG